MATLLICRTCGARTQAELASNEQDLVNVGMLERSCAPCGKATRWGLAQDYRRVQRRSTERRNMRAPAPGSGERRGNERRSTERRKTR
jgi:hypothetical protein